MKEKLVMICEKVDECEMINCDCYHLSPHKMDVSCNWHCSGLLPGSIKGCVCREWKEETDARW